MRNWFTFHRWSYSPWQMYSLVAIFWASMWQVLDATDASHVAVPVANLAGSVLALGAMHIRDVETARAVERWAYVMLVWSLSCYLALALHYEGIRGLWHQPNLGITLTMGVCLAAVHRFFYGLITKRVHQRRVRVEAKKLVQAAEKLAEG